MFYNVPDPILWWEVGGLADDDVDAGRAEWLDNKSHRKCLILWRRIPDWADLLLEFVRRFIGAAFQFVNV